MKECYFSVISFLIFALFLQRSTCSYGYHHVSNHSSNRSEFIYQSFQLFAYCTPSTSIKIPANVEEIQEIVQSAIKNSQTVKAFGSRHSATDIICTDGIPISMEKINYAINNGDGTATFGAGIQVMDALIFLEKKNLSLIQMVTYGGMTIGGATGTGSHGSSLLHPATFSDQVVSLTVIDGTGNIQKITTPHILKAFRVHLGLLGIIIDVTLATVPPFKMTVAIEVHPDSVFFNGQVLEWAETLDSFNLNWFPSTEEVVVLNGVYLDDLNIPGNASVFTFKNWTPDEIVKARQSSETLHFLHAIQALISQEKASELSMYSNSTGNPHYTEDGVTLANPATGSGWRLLTSRCDHCYWDNGNQSLFDINYTFAVATSELAPAIQTIKNILKEHNAPFPSSGLNIKFSKASNALMALETGRPSAHIEWDTFIRNDQFQTAKVGLAAYQAMAQALVKEHNARPHWGKVAPHYFTDEVFKTSAPNRHKFIKVMKKFDPNGIFLNKFGRRFLGKSNKMDMDPRVKHCALEDYCICAKDDDCAPLQICSSILGYSVCKDSWEPPSINVISSVLESLPK